MRIFFFSTLPRSTKKKEDTYRSFYAVLTTRENNSCVKMPRQNDTQRDKDHIIKANEYLDICSHFLFTTIFCGVCFDAIKWCTILWTVSSFISDECKLNRFLCWGYIINTLERRLGMDLNGDGYIGGMGKYLNMCNIFWQNCDFVVFFRLSWYDRKNDGTRYQWRRISWTTTWCSSGISSSVWTSIICLRVWWSSLCN